MLYPDGNTIWEMGISGLKNAWFVTDMHEMNMQNMYTPRLSQNAASSGFQFFFSK